MAINKRIYAHTKTHCLILNNNRYISQMLHHSQAKFILKKYNKNISYSNETTKYTENYIVNMS